MIKEDQSLPYPAAGSQKGGSEQRLPSVDRKVTFGTPRARLEGAKTTRLL